MAGYRASRAPRRCGHHGTSNQSTSHRGGTCKMPKERCKITKRQHPATFAGNICGRPPWAAGCDRRVCLAGTSARSGLACVPRITAKPVLWLLGAIVHANTPQHPAAAAFMALGRIMATASVRPSRQNLGTSHFIPRKHMQVEHADTSTAAPQTQFLRWRRED